MSSGFSFPPPPPPPPSSTVPTAYPPQFDNSRGRGGRGNQHRGRGRGGGGGRHNRGGRGAYGEGHLQGTGFGNHGHYAQHPTPPDSQYGYQGAQPTQPQNSPHNPYGIPPQSNQPHSLPYGYLPGSQYPQPPPSPYNPALGRQQPPQPIGPPMRWGFDQMALANGPHLQQYPTGGFNNTNFRHPSPYGAHARPNKRHHDTAFGKLQSQPQPQLSSIPLPGPTGYNSLPSKPPPSVDATRKPKKQQRKFNQLGLTPKAEEHESSDEEADIDEEAKLAQPGQAAGQLKFSYKGRECSLQSPADITAWIAERKKRFPTQAKIEARKKEEEQKKAVRDAKRVEAEKLRKEKIAEREETRRLKLKEVRDKREQKKLERKESREQQHIDDPSGAAEKSKRKTEKLRKKLMKEEKRLAQAEAEAERIRQQKQGDTANSDGKAVLDQGDTADSDGKVIRDQGDLKVEGIELNGEKIQPAEEPAEGLAVMSEQGPKDVVDEGTTENIPASCPALDETSSSGSDLSSSDESDTSTGDSEDGSSPEEATSKRQKPDRVPPPPRQQKKNPCHAFMKTGQCHRGTRCKYSHDASEKPQKNTGKAVGQQESQEATRQSLFQKLIAKQKEEEDRRVMRAIAWLGERGLLDETAPTTDPASPPAPKADSSTEHVEDQSCDC